MSVVIIAQQAELHDGRAYFTDSPLGGIRLVLDIAAARPADGAVAIGSRKPNPALARRSDAD